MTFLSRPYGAAFLIFQNTKLFKSYSLEISDIVKWSKLQKGKNVTRHFGYLCVV